MKFPKLKRPEYKKMYEVVKQNLSPYYSRGILEILIVSFFKYCLVFFALSPLLKASLSQTVSSQTYLFSLIFSAILVFLVRIICEILNFGLVIYFSNAIVSKNAKFTDCFSGFNKFSSHPYKIGTIFALISTLALLVDFILVFSFKDFFTFDFPAEVNAQNIQDVFANSVMNYYPKMMILILVFALIYYAIKMFFVFTWSVLRDFSSESTKQIFQKNFMMIHKNYFHFIGFNFYINLKNIAILAACYVIQLVIPENVAQKLELLSIVLNFIVFIEEFTILAKIYSSIPIYYYSLLSVNDLIKAHSLKIVVDDDVNSHDGNTEILISDDDDDADSSDGDADVAEVDADGEASDAFVDKTDASVSASAALVDKTDADGEASAALGEKTGASVSTSAALGEKTDASVSTSDALVDKTDASVSTSAASGEKTGASVSASDALGEKTGSSAKKAGTLKSAENKSAKKSAVKKSKSKKSELWKFCLNIKKMFK